MSDGNNVQGNEEKDVLKTIESIKASGSLTDIDLDGAKKGEDVKSEAKPQSAKASEAGASSPSVPKKGGKEKKPKKRKMTLMTKNAIAGYLFILPFIIGFVVFMVYPLIESLRMSFSDVNIGDSIGGFSMKWIGLENYNKALRVDPIFVRALTEEVRGMLLDLPATLIFSFFIALLLNQSFKARGFVRAIFFLPVILSSGVIVGLELNNALVQGVKDAMQENANTTSITAVLERIFEGAGVGGGMFNYIFGLIDHVYDIAIASGIQIIIFLSALQTISVSMYEAAKIEGCTAWESFWKITLPMVSSMILVNIIYTIVDFFVRSDNAVMTKISDTMIDMIDYGFSSSMAWIYFVVCMLIIGILTAIISRLVYYYE